MGGKARERELWPVALRVLAGVGDAAAGEWREWSGYAVHLRRRLSVEEGAAVGPVVDCRGTDEWDRRYEAARAHLPPSMLGMAMLERRG